MTKAIGTTLSILFLALSGCGDDSESDARNAVRKVLKDPDSAKFGEFTVVPFRGFEMACLRVNAKNSYGGYEFQEIILVKRGGGSWKAGDAAMGVSHASCVRTMQQKKAEANDR